MHSTPYAHALYAYKPLSYYKRTRLLRHFDFVIKEGLDELNLGENAYAFVEAKVDNPNYPLLISLSIYCYLIK